MLMSLSNSSRTSSNRLLDQQGGYRIGEVPFARSEGNL